MDPPSDDSRSDGGGDEGAALGAGVLRRGLAVRDAYLKAHERVEAVVGWRRGGGQGEERYLAKLRGQSHLHCCWLTEAKLAHAGEHRPLAAWRQTVEGAAAAGGGAEELLAPCLAACVEVGAVLDIKPPRGKRRAVRRNSTDLSAALLDEEEDAGDGARCGGEGRVGGSSGMEGSIGLEGDATGGAEPWQSGEARRDQSGDESGDASGDESGEWSCGEEPEVLPLADPLSGDEEEEGGEEYVPQPRRGRSAAHLEERSLQLPPPMGRDTASGQLERAACRGTTAALRLPRSGSLLLVRWRGLGWPHSTWEAWRDVRHAAGAPRAWSVFLQLSATPPAPAPGEEAMRRAQAQPFDAAAAEVGARAGLRGYQEEGVRWLLACWHAGRSSILADEMGLGKTAQARRLPMCACGTVAPGFRFSRRVTG